MGTKITSMSSGAIDPIAVTKRVFWRPATPGTALIAGDPVCYKLDAVDQKERTVDPVHLGLTRDTYAEGEQEMTGRLFSVEEPLIDNIDQFAGIVKSLGPKAGLDGDMIEIFKANSGAVVPANVVLTTTTVGRTLLAVMVGTRTLGSPTMDIPTYSATAGSIDSKIVGIAMETLTAAGKCWVKLDENMFTHQGGQLGQEFLIEAVADDVTVNQMNVEFKNTQDHCQLLHYRAKLSGTGDVHASRGIFRYEAFLNHTGGGSSHIFGMDILMDIGSGVTNEYLAALKVTLRTRNANPDLSSAGSGYYAACLFLEYIMTETTSGTLTYPPRNGTLIYANTDTGGTTPEYFLFANGPEALAITSDDVAAGDSAALSILIAVGGTEYHIPIYTDAEIE
jgi:hypothetical protein